MNQDRRLWIDTTGQPVITTTPNGVKNATRWGWTEAEAIPLAGHEAATRTRVVTTVTELDALPVGSVVLCSDSQAREVMHSLRSGEMHGALRAFNGEHLIHEGRLLQVLPARVMYEPEEDR